MSLTLILALTLAGCLGKKSTDTPTAQTPIAELQARVASIESKLASLSERVATINPQASNEQLQQDFNALQQDLNNLSTAISSLEARIEELEVVKEEEEEDEVIPDTIARWYEDIATSNSESITFDYYIRPSKIEEDGDYDVRITLYNSTTSKLDKVVVGITFTPKTGARVYIDDKNTFLDPIASPFVMWSTEVITRGDDKYARRITCTSDYYTIPAGVLDDKGTPDTTDDVIVPGKLELRLVFSLTYK